MAEDDIRQSSGVSARRGLVGAEIPSIEAGAGAIDFLRMRNIVEEGFEGAPTSKYLTDQLSQITGIFNDMQEAIRLVADRIPEGATVEHPQYQLYSGVRSVLSSRKENFLEEMGHLLELTDDPTQGRAFIESERYRRAAETPLFEIENIRQPVPEEQQIKGAERAFLENAGINLFEDSSRDEALEAAADKFNNIVTYLERHRKDLEDQLRKGDADIEQRKNLIEQHKQLSETTAAIQAKMPQAELGTPEYRQQQRAERATREIYEPLAGDEPRRAREQAAIARSQRYATGEISPELMQDLKSTQENLEFTHSQLLEKLNQGAALSEDSKAEMISELVSVRNAVQEVKAFTGESNQQQQNAMNNMVSFVGKIMGALAVGQLTSKFALQDPFQYEFTPAMNALSQQGEIGGLLSEALSASEQYNLQLNQMGLQSGFALTGAGTALGVSARGMGGRIGGGALGALGLGVGALSITGVTDDIFDRLGLGKSDDEIIANTLAQNLLNPQRIGQLYTSARPGMIAAGAGENLGFAGGTRTGNTLLDELSYGDNYNLAGLGYSGDQISQLLSGAATQLRGGRDELFSATDVAATLEATYGVSSDQTLATLSSIQRAGAESGTEASRLYQSMGAVAESGRVSTFAQNVLVPALNQVVEGAALQNVSRTNEALTEQIFGLRTIISDSDTNLSRLVKTNPEAFSRIYNSMAQGARSAFNDPARLSYNLSMGSSYEDIISGDPDVTARIINSLMPMMQRLVPDFSDTDALLALSPIGMGLTGIDDPQIVAELFRLAADSGGRISTEDVDLLRLGEEGEEATLEAESRVRGAELTTILERLADQTNTFNASIMDNLDEVKNFQDVISDFINSESFDRSIIEGVETIITTFQEAIGMDQDEIDRQANVRRGMRDVLSGNQPQNFFDVGNVSYNPSSGTVLVGGEEVENPSRYISDLFSERLVTPIDIDGNGSNYNRYDQLLNFNQTRFFPNTGSPDGIPIENRNNNSEDNTGASNVQTIRVISDAPISQKEQNERLISAINTTLSFGA
mgnify:CR=1 FL=1